MRKFIVATDSTSCIELVDPGADVEVLPLYLHFRGEKLRDNVDISTTDFIRWMENNPNELPHSSPPTEEDIKAMIERWIDLGYEDALFVTLSSAISQTHSLISRVAQQYRRKIRVMVFDSKSLSYPQVKLLLMGKKLLEQGHPLPSVVTQLEFMRRRGSMFFTVRTLNYLIKNGRLSSGKGMIARFFKIHPLMTFNEQGLIVPVVKKRRLNPALKEVITKEINVVNGRKADIFVACSTDPVGKKFIDIAKQRIGLDNNFIVMPPSPVIACHTGPGVYAVGAFLDHEA